MNASLLLHTERVMFETTQYCPYAPFHVKCPVHFFKNPATLPTSIVLSVLHLLGDAHFKGRLSFHNYGECFADPRLFSFLRSARSLCPTGHIFLMTNGWNLNQTLMNELSGLVDSLETTGYNSTELLRLQKLRAPGGTAIRAVRRPGLDDRMQIYNCAHRIYKRKDPGCGAPLGQIIIRATGHVGLCCNDWASVHTYGDLKDETLEDVLKKGHMLRDYKRLSKGDYFYGICKACQRCGAAIGQWRDGRWINPES